MGGVGFVPGLVLFVLFGVLGSWLLQITWSHQRTLPLQSRLFWYALTIRFAFSILIYRGGLVNVLGDFDAAGWYYGVAVYEAWVGAGVTPLKFLWVVTGAFEGEHRGYYYLVASLFYVTNMPVRLAAAALNCFLGALTVVFVHRMARLLFSEQVAYRAGWWTCLFPSMIIWSAQTVKEPVVVLLETVALYTCVRLKVLGFSLRHAVLCGLVIVLVIPFRFYAAYLCAGAVAVSLLMPQFGRGRSRLGSAIAILALAVPLVIASGVLAQHEAEFERFDLQFIQEFRVNVAEGTGSGVRVNVDMTTPKGFGIATAIGAAHLLLAPFPWQLGGGSVRMMLTTPELIYWWWLFYAGVVPGFLYVVRRRFADVQPMIFFIFGLGLLYSMMFGNVGLVFRQRAQILPWLLIFGAVGLELREKRRLEQARARAGLGTGPALGAAGALRRH